MSQNNVIPFRKRPPSESELEVYRRVTHNWSPQMRALIFPEHFKREQQERGPSGGRWTGG